MEVENLLGKLKEYYKNNCKQLVFVNEKKLSVNNSCKMYFLDVLNEQELKNYKKLFQEYYVSYIRNRDILSVCKPLIEATTDSELSSALISEGKKIKERSIIYPDIDTRSEGIYGELFDDFYLNIVKDEPVMMSYSVRSGFNDPNPKGVDILGIKVINNGECEFIFSEAKFVQDIYSASDALYKDIVGTPTQIGHVTKEYINRYLYFALNKNHSLNFEDSDKIEIIKSKVLDINEMIINDDIEPVDAFNNLNIKIRFDFFAIYHDDNYDIEQRKHFFEKVANQFNTSIVATGINNYEMEIIFIPTKNTSMDLKEGMKQWD